MSKFSGKFDLYDAICIMGDGNIETGFEKFNGTRLYIGDKTNQLEYKTLKDLVPYFPYIPKTSYSDNTDSTKSMIVLTEKSWNELRKEKYGADTTYYDTQLEKEIRKHEKKKYFKEK